MRNLIAFFRRFRIFMAFVLLQIVALLTYANYSEFARLQALTTSGSFNAKVVSVRNNVTKHFKLEQTNRKLAFENKWLRTRLKSSNYKVDRELVRIDDTLYKQEFEYLPATVIQSTFDKRNNYMTIDIGSKQGVKRGMGVISPLGVIGIIHSVGEHFSLIKTILSKNINVDVMLEKGGAFGLLKWDQTSPRIVQVSGISNDMHINKWSRVITRGGSGIFPRGIPVGRISERKSIEGKPLWDIQVVTAEDFRSVQMVYVVKNLLLKEIQQMDNAIPMDKEEKEF